jgi:hypothetical protein
MATKIEITEGGGLTRVEIKDGRRMRALFYVAPSEDVMQTIAQQQSRIVEFAAAHAEPESRTSGVRSR